MDSVKLWVWNQPWEVVWRGVRDSFDMKLIRRVDQELPIPNRGPILDAIAQTVKWGLK